MNRDLYFVPILAKALAEPDVQQSLEKAFAAIERLGHQERHAEGYSNFCQFMSESYARRWLLNEQAVRIAILRCAASSSTETEDREALIQMEKNQSPRFRDEYEALSQEFARCTVGSRVPIVQILRNGRELGQVRFLTRRGRRTIDGIGPGDYALKLESGLIIWEGQLCARDLIWTEAFGERSLELAAETIEIHRQPAREIQVPEAALTLRTFPGLEAGSLEIELTP